MSPLREELASYAHETRSGWIRYFFSKAHKNADGTVTLPLWAVDRWTRQMNTPYNKLPQEERGSDKAEADKILQIVKDALLEKIIAA